MKVNFDGKNFDNHFFQFQFKKKKNFFTWQQRTVKEKLEGMLLQHISKL